MLVLNFRAFSCSHTLSNKKFNAIADLSIPVKDRITQMLPIGPTIQVHVADSILSSSSQRLAVWHLPISVAVSKSSSYILKFSNLSPKLHEATEQLQTRTSILDKPFTFNENMFLHPMSVFFKSFSLQCQHLVKRMLQKLQVYQET